ncbi:hypothetical protein [Methylomarinum vadi]|uniref:hypothetical protein n=1 Tax=Methylomarinum vadi TaxID=438855 RepID=UPI0004DEFB9D|nr:hypothetical protein [Methylomarinum vadi]
MKIELLRNPLEARFEQERKILLLVSAVGVAVAWAGFIPQGFDVLGIKSGEIDPTGFTRMLALAVLYYLISFCAHAVMDWKSWQWRLIRQEGSQTFETLAELNNSIGSYINVFATAFTAFFTNKIVFSKVIFDLLLPFIVGLYALFVLFSWEPPAAKIISIIHKKQAAANKPTIVFINSGATFITDKESESMATIIVPFAKEAACDAPSTTEWTGTKIDSLHRSFLLQLSKDLSQCGSENKPIRLQVRGFASSSKVVDYAKCNNASSDEEANLFIADARRDNVIRYLSKNRGKYLRIESYDWQGDYKKMQRQRRYSDRFMSREYSKARGQLNRRVEIVLLDAGECDIANQ